jgi:hypothetical protein
MNTFYAPKYLGILLITIVTLSACSIAKIESRLEANPQCKEVVNPKTGATMPCPGPEQFVRAQASTPSVGMTSVVPATPSTSGVPSSTIPVAAPSPKAQPVPPCKPQLNTKTGSLMPCPNG